MSRRISDSTIRRLSHYLRALEDLERSGCTTVSSEELAERGGTTAAQVRKDLSQFGSFGKRGFGYDVAALSARLREILGLERRWKVVLVGAGRIGSALFAYPNFARRGYDCVAVLDSDPAKVGTRWGSVEILPATDLEKVIRSTRADLVILAVPPEAAQSVAERAVAAGVKGILNFAALTLRLPEHIPVANVNLALELEALSYAVTHASKGLVTRASSSSLVRWAEVRLRSGPAHTLELARDVLGLRGHAGAASAAVFQLLGADPRFAVDRNGVWHLEPSAEAPALPLSEVSFAVVDVETTGGSAERGDRITEIAVVEMRGGGVVDTWHTLVNPGRRIPPGVTALTGITDAMVVAAPWFENVADEVICRLEGRVFVAHNAVFDWSFVSGELLRARGECPALHRLCTVRMVRRLVPGLRYRNLDVVSRHFGVEIPLRHRALGDALATARILVRLLEAAAGKGLEDLARLEAHLSGSRRRRGP